MAQIFSFPDGRTVELDGSNAHPFSCVICESCYRGSRYAAKCCKVASLDLRDRSRYNYSEVDEIRFQAEDEARWDAIIAEHHLECSCGESFKTVEDAVSCRKCRTYTMERRCTSVTDRNTGKVVWRESC